MWTTGTEKGELHERNGTEGLKDALSPVQNTGGSRYRDHQLQSILNLPKGTEHFLTDIHGEYEQFNHVLKNGSGSVRRKIDEEFGNTISSKDKKSGHSHLLSGEQAGDR